MTGHRLVFETGEQAVDEAGEMLTEIDYAYGDMQIYRVTGVLSNPREPFKTLELEPVKTSQLKVG